MWADGSRYEGEWYDDAKQGRGSCVYAVDGGCSGYFLRCFPMLNQPAIIYVTLDAPEYSWCSGDVFEGFMEGNTRHGPCTYTFFNGQRHEFQWSDGCCPEFNEAQRRVLDGFSVVSAILEQIGVGGLGGVGAALQSFRRGGELLSMMRTVSGILGCDSRQV